MIWVFKAIFKGGFIPIFAFAHIHSVKMKPDQIQLVKTALGIATIVEAPEAVQSAIIGDQSGFKIEYVDKAVTIKPLRPGARTNLYLQTASRRYDLRLETNRQESADYVVYLKPSRARAPILWREVNIGSSGKKLSIKCVRLAVLPQESFLLDFKISAKEKLKFLPENVWIKQGKDSKVINGLFLSKLEVVDGRPTLLGITLLKSDLIKGKAVEVLVKAEEETARVTLQAELLWK